jgi:hypothetical protein
MLTEIYCNKFLDKDGKERGRIPLHKGLNTVLGSGKSDNSIGKSSFLLAIDFAFGGYTYPTKEIKNEIEDHTVCWTMEFDGDKKFYFCRNTDDKDHIWKCDKDYTIIDGTPIEMEDYKSFLYDKYKMTTDEREYNFITSLFMRIFPKDCANNVSRPLLEYRKQPDYDGITILEKVMNYYIPIKKEKDARDEAVDDSNALSDAEGRKIVVKLTQKDYENNLVKIDNLNKQLADLGYKANEAKNDKEKTNDSALADINNNMKTLRERRYELYARRRLLQSRDTLTVEDIKSDLDSLKQFFGDSVNIEAIEKIQGFHEKLQSILLDQAKTELSEINVEIDGISSRISELSKSMVEMEEPAGVSTEYVSKITDIKANIMRLEDVNKTFKDREGVRDGVKKAKSELRVVEETKLSDMQTVINNALSAFIQEMFHDESHSRPDIIFSSSAKYLYNSYGDGGAGTSYRDLILFDLAVMKLTSLPVLAHDNHLTKPIEDDTVEKIFPVYQEVGKDKQVFVAFDGLPKFQSPELTKEIEDTTVLRLSKKDGNYLYGIKFKTKRPEPKPKESKEEPAEQMSLFEH